MVGLAVNVTGTPMQIDVVLTAIDTDGITDVVVMAIELLVAINGFAQGSLLFITTVITSPLLSVALVKVEAVCPLTFMPFIFH